MKDTTRYACFTVEQQRIFDKLNQRQQKYIVYRSRGVSRKEAWLASGYNTSPRNAGIDSYKLEKSNPVIGELISAMSGNAVRVKIEDTIESAMDKIERSIGKKNLEILNDKVREPNAEMVASLPEDTIKDLRLKDFSNMNPEDAKRLDFYRSIAEGRIKNIKITKTYDKDGNLTGRKVEESSDVDSRIKARKEIDRILGLQDILDLGQLAVGDINITIVDASKKQAIDDQRNQDPQEIVGETIMEESDGK